MIDLEAQSEGHGCIVLTQCSQETNLTGLRIGDVELVSAKTIGGAPDTLAKRNHLFVFRELDLGRKRQAIRIAGDQRIQILVYESFQAGPVTGWGGPLSAQRRACE